jgi:hypothetical protein
VDIKKPAKLNGGQKIMFKTQIKLQLILEQQPTHLLAHLLLQQPLAL